MIGEMLDNERLLNDVGVSPLECGSTSMPQIPKGGLLVRVSVVIKNDNYYQIPKGGLLVRVSVVIKNDNYYQVFDYVSGFNRRYYSHLRS